MQNNYFFEIPADDFFDIKNPSSQGARFKVDNDLIIIIS